MAIRNFLNADIFSNAPQMLFEPDGGDGSGAGGAAVLEEGEEGSEGEEEKTFTQKDLDRIVQDRVKKLDRELKKKNQHTAEQDKKLQELEEKIKSLSAGGGGGSGDEGSLDTKTLQGRLEKQQLRFEQEIAQLRTKAEESEKARLAAEEKQRLGQRDTEIRQALVSAGCLPTAMVAAERYFVPSVTWDEDDAVWLFKTSEGSTLTVSEGIAAELPPYFKSSAMAGGGSGTSSSKEKKRVELQSNLKDAEAKYAQLCKEMRASGNEPRLMAQVMAQEKVVKRIKADLAAK